MDRKKLRWLTQTALLIALLIAAQWTTRPLGQFVTGSAVNLILIVSVSIIGLPCGITVAAVSNILAFLAGIGPIFPQLVPFVAAGNVMYVFVFWLVSGRRRTVPPVWRRFAAVVAGALVKFAVLWFGIVKFAAGLIPDIKPAQIEKLSVMFSWPQIVTATIGGSLAAVALPAIFKAVKNKK